MDNNEEKLVQKKQNQKKNALFGIVALLIVAVIGGTIAYFSSTATFVNEFETATYKTVTTEVFESPSNWTPGETIPKTIATTNEGSIPVAVRVSYTEAWKDLEGNSVASPANAVTINFDNTTEWTKEGNYYYYNYKLNPNETTSSFISGVTLNNTASTVTCTPSQDGKTQTCEATDPALGKKYKLTITTETVQADKYTEAWNTSLVIGDKPAPAPAYSKYYYYDSANDQMTETTTKDNTQYVWIAETPEGVKKVCGKYTNSDVCFGLADVDYDTSNHAVIEDGQKNLDLMSAFETAGSNACTISWSALTCGSKEVVDESYYAAVCGLDNYGDIYCSSGQGNPYCSISSSGSYNCFSY